MTFHKRTSRHSHKPLVVLSAFLLSGILAACSDDSNNPSGANNPPANDPAAGGALSCAGNRVWTAGTSDVNPRYEDLVSEGGPQVGIQGNSVTPCAIYWLYDASANCSLAFSAEVFYPDVLQEQLPSPLTLVTAADGSLSVTAGADSGSLPASGISFDQLLNAPNCN